MAATIRQIAQLGHPVLRTRAEEVTEISCAETQDLIDDMFATLAEQRAAGLAAPQVYESKRIFIISSRPSAARPNAPLLPPSEIINPVIESTTANIVKDWEGCLSIPGLRVLVPRADSIKVSYQTRTGEKITATFDGFLARVFQHEFDHLEGKVFFDRVESNLDIITEREYLRLLNL